MSTLFFVNRSRTLLAACLFCAACAFSPQAKTRWSAVHFIPDADLLQGGQFVFDAEGYYTADTAGKALLNPGGFLTLGIMEWVNIEAGYSGGPTFGLKARILGETQAWMPSLALGVHDVISNKDAGLFASEDSTMTNQVYLAVSKSIEPLKMRIHLGVQTIPASKKDQIDPYVGIEEYFGAGVYVSIEVFSLKGQYHPALFGSYRLFNKQLELSAGIVEVNKLFFDQNSQFKFSPGSKTSGDFVKPGVWFGLRYSFVMGFAKSDGFKSIDDRVAAQSQSIRELSLQIDSLRRLESDGLKRLSDVNKKLASLSDSMGSDKTRLKPMLLEKIIGLKNLYAEEPFEPERVKRAKEEIVALRDDALPPLRELITDKKIDKRVRVLCISLLGDIGNSDASDILLDVLSQTQDPEIKIEILISLGKMRETRAEYVLEQLANDPVDEVAFTAQQVLLKLSKETGMKVSPDAKIRKLFSPDTVTIADAKIKTKLRVDTVAAAPKINASATPAKQAFDTAKAPLRSASAAPADTGGKVQKAHGEDVWGMGDSAKAASSTPLVAAPQKATAPVPPTVKDTTSVKNPAAAKQAAKPSKPSAPTAPAADKNW